MVSISDFEQIKKLFWRCVNSIKLMIIRYYIYSESDVDIGSTLLHRVVYDKELEKIKLLLEDGDDVNAKDNNGATPLHSIIPVLFHLT